jgi:hypothetical protein
MKPTRLLQRAVSLLSSFGLVSAILALLFLVVLLGTFEQVDHGLFAVQKKYFEGFFLITDARIFGSPPIRVPLIGAVPLLGLLTLNLLVGGILRLRKSGRTLGILITHLGVVLMIAAGLVKLTMSQDGHLQIYEGASSDEFVSYYAWEVRVWELTGEKEVREHVVAHRDLVDLTEGRRGRFRHPDLPFVLELSNFVPNCQPMPKGPMWEADSPVIEGWALRAFARDPQAERNTAGMVARALDADRNEEVRASGLLWSFERSLPWTFSLDGRRWVVSLRHEAYPMPFRVRLDDFRHELHPRIETAKAFESDVTLFDLGAMGEKGKEGIAGESREVLISMNDPLRHRGLVLFQSGYGPPGARPGDRMYSDFSVVRNPSDHWPLYSCIIIGAGLLLAFIRKLLGYIRSQSPSRARETKSSSDSPVAQEAA